ncbi:MAG: acetamidase/formamidase family protein [Chloroflexota bacterium]
MAQHHLDCSTIHRDWDNSRPPRLVIASGDTVSFDVQHSALGRFEYGDPHEKVANAPRFNGHALTGPVAIAGAEPGHVLQIDTLELKTADWGWTMISPGRGLLPEDFADTYVQYWDLRDGQRARLNDRVSVPIEPFHGVMGLAPAASGPHVTAPPRRVGGNLDVKQIGLGSTLYLPIEAPGALFSVGDAHAAQGDGEVCITAIETGMTSTLRFTLRTDFSIDQPEFKTGGPILRNTDTADWYATTGVAPDLMDATKMATRGMIRYLGREHDLTREEAYILCSVAMDLKISEVVDAPNWVVSAFMPLSLFDR